MRSGGWLGILFNVALVLAVIYVVAIPIGWLLRGLFTNPRRDRRARRRSRASWIALPLMVIGLGPLVGRQVRNWLSKFHPGRRGARPVAA